MGVGGWGLPLYGLLLTRNTLSGKRENRQRGDRKPQWAFAAFSSRFCVPPCSGFIYTPRHNNLAQVWAPGRQKGSLKLKVVGLLKEKALYQMHFPPSNAEPTAWPHQALKKCFLDKARKPPKTDRVMSKEFRNEWEKTPTGHKGAIWVSVRITAIDWNTPNRSDISNQYAMYMLCGLFCSDT